jgi:hypothetical protein
MQGFEQVIYAAIAIGIPFPACALVVWLWF